MYILGFMLNINITIYTVQYFLDCKDHLKSQYNLIGRIFEFLV